MKGIIFSGRINKLMPSDDPGADRKAGLLLLLFLSAVIAGAALGAVSSKYADSGMMKKLDLIFLTNIQLRSSGNALALFTASLASNFLFLLAVFLLGLTLWGEAAVIALPFLKGYGYGLIAGFIYSSCGVNGIIYNILVILPGALVFAAVISAASREAFMNSLKLCRLLRSGDEPEGCASGLQLKRYFISMLWLLFLTVLACTVDMLLSLMLSWLFGF